MYGVDDGEAFTAHVEPGEAAALAEWLDRMRFMMRVEVEDLTDDGRGVASGLGLTSASGSTTSSPAPSSRTYAEAAGPACGHVGLRGAAHRPRRAPLRPGHRPPHHPQRGRLDPVGRAPRQGLLPRAGDGRARAHPRPPAASADPAAPRRLRQPAPTRGAPVLHGEKEVGFVGSSARHYEAGPIALALLKRNVPVDARWTPTGCPPRRRSSSTPRSGCTCARCAEARRQGGSGLRDGAQPPPGRSHSHPTPTAAGLGERECSERSHQSVIMRRTTSHWLALPRLLSTASRTRRRWCSSWPFLPAVRQRRGLGHSRWFVAQAQSRAAGRRRHRRA